MDEKQQALLRLALRHLEELQLPNGAKNISTPEALITRLEAVIEAAPEKQDAGDIFNMLAEATDKEFL